MVWTFGPADTALRQVKTTFQQLGFRDPPGPLGEGLVLRPSCCHTPEPACQTAQEVPASSPQSSWHQLPRASWKHSSGLQIPGLMGNPTLKQRQPCSRASIQHKWLVGGYEWQPGGRPGSTSQGSSCGSGRLARSLISEPLRSHNQQLLITGHLQYAGFHRCPSYWIPPTTQQRRKCYPHLQMRDPRLRKIDALSHSHRDRKPQGWI